MNQRELSFRSVDHRLIERDGIADAGVQELVVVGVVPHVAAVEIDVKAHPVLEGLRQPAFVVVAPRRLHGQVQHRRVNLVDPLRTGDQDVLKRRRLEDPIKGSVQHHIQRWQERPMEMRGLKALWLSKS